MVNEVGIRCANAGDMLKLKHCSLLRLQINPERIHFLKYILEGYDGLALLSTADARQGIVEIRYPPEIEYDLKQLLQSIEPQIVNNIS
jgi:hypothetical protein